MKRQSQSVLFARAVAQITRSLTGVPLAMALGGLLALTVNAAEGQRSRGTRGPHEVEPARCGASAVLGSPQVEQLAWGLPRCSEERGSRGTEEQGSRGELSIPTSDFQLPTSELLVSESFTPREVEFQAPQTPQTPQAPSKVSPRSFKPESYLVYINENSSLLLQQVQRLEPTAFVRQYNGRAVIQAGIFNQNSNAHKLANELESKGIDTRIVSLASGKDTDFVSNYKFYFVMIPAKQDKLAAIEDKVKQLKMGMQVSISQKEEPRTHVRVGPFLEKEQAENWKRYLKASGLRKARVYYGH